MVQIIMSILICDTFVLLLPRSVHKSTRKRDTDTFNLHSFIKEKYSHTRSTHCSALLIMIINCLMQMNKKNQKKKKPMEDRQLNQKTHFFKV